MGIRDRPTAPRSPWQDGHTEWLIGSMPLNPDFAGALDNSKWVMGTHNAIETVRAFDPYTLKDSAPRIHGDVLILAGANDHFVPVSQVQAFERSLTGARSVTTRIYDKASGGAEHCQLGAVTLWHRDFFDWVTAKFGDAVPARL
jgi:pimeloyl-ACP methyl ester carboxylesterase